MTQTVNFEMKAGDWLDLFITVRDKNGDPVEILGSTIRWWLSKKTWKVDRANGVDEADIVLLRKSTADAAEVEISAIETDHTVASFVVHLRTADTEDLEGTYYHEAEVILSDGFVKTPITGRAKFVADLIIPSGHP